MFCLVRTKPDELPSDKNYNPTKQRQVYIFGKNDVEKLLSLETLMLENTLLRGGFAHQFKIKCV